MGRIPSIPRELLTGAFTLEDARRAGISRSSLRGKAWQRLSTGLYTARQPRLDPLDVLRGWVRALPEGTTFAGATALWLHGIHQLDPLHPVEVIVAPDKGVRSRDGLTARRCVLGRGDFATCRGVPATTVNKTLVDICSWRSPLDALIVLDMAIASRVADVLSVTHYANSIRGRPGSLRLRELAQMAAPAESPMETRLRWLFATAGLPRPEVQVELRDGDGSFVARADLYYPSARLVIEFDGANHKERLVSDDRRQNLIVNAGYRLLRYTTADLKDRADVIVLQVEAALATSANRAL